MKILRTASVLVAMWVGAASSARDSRGLEVLVTADAISSPEGFRPKPGQPIHYLFSQTRNSLGEAVGGVKLPDPALIERLIVAELAKQGFVRTGLGGPMPAIYILAIVGDANFKEPPDDNEDLEPYVSAQVARPLLERNFLGRIYSKFGISGIFSEQPTLDPDEQDRLRAQEILRAEAIRIRYRQSPRYLDRAGIHALVGGDKVNRAVAENTLARSAAERIAWAAHDDQYYVSLNAFDAARFAKKERVLLWRTSMLIDWRKNFAAELPNMLAHAGPLFGTDAPLPTFVDERDRRKAEVQVGEVKVAPEDNRDRPRDTKK